MPEFPLSGGCLCGAVRYEIGEVVGEPSTCHCRMCQKHAGAPFIHFVTVPRDRLHVAGEMRLYRSSPYAERGFCPACGSTLSFAYHHEPDRIGIAAVTLDDPEAIPPQRHWGVESQLSWLKLDDGLPRQVTEDDTEFMAAIAEHGGRAP